MAFDDGSLILQPLLYIEVRFLVILMPPLCVLRGTATVDLARLMPTPAAAAESELMGSRVRAMTRAELQEAVAGLEYLIRKRFDPAKIEKYAAQLQAFREELRVLEEKETLAASAPLRFLFQHTVMRLIPKRTRPTRR